MIVKVLKNEKELLEIELENLTIAELLRNFLWEDEAVTLAAWRREHPTKNPVLIIKTKGKSAKKALLDCIARIEKLNQKVLEEFKKTVKK
jgi:DNA-directed RNA polymerase subunit L